jgi:LAS superfamily LD-carboxypeptidase LdcB
MGKGGTKYKMTGFAKFIIFCTVMGGLVYGLTNFVNLSDYISDKDKVNMTNLEHKITEKIQKKLNKSKSKENVNSQTDTYDHLEKRLLELIAENEQLSEELEKCKSSKLDLVENH